MATCPQCHTPLPDDAPEGLCPACLLQRGLEANTLAGETQPASPEGGVAPEPERQEKWTPPTLDELAPFFPDLDLLEFLGRGGMGAVYKARQKSLDRVVALKILPPAIGQDAAFAARFTYEAQAMARLNHPHIVTIYEFGQRTAAGLQGDKARAPSPPLSASVPQSLGASALYFFLMEFVDGLTLRHLINARTLRPQDALAIVPQICDALQYAHDRGIIHRDIKPENILLTRGGQIKIADFGLAKLIGVNAPPPAAAETSPLHTTVAGTPAYMAPEQAQTPDGLSAVDHRADIYALGVVFYQLLTGELPKDGGMFVPPSKKVHIDVRLDEIVLRALEKSPDLRYQNATQLKTEVETVISTPPAVPANNPPDLRPINAAFVGGAVPPSATRPRGRLSSLAVAGAMLSAVFFLVFLATVFQLYRWGRVIDVVARGTEYELEWQPAFLSLRLLVPLTWGLGLLASIGTTVCGIVSAIRIRQRKGELRGMVLAVFDTLVFPLLILDTLIWLVLTGIMKYIVAVQNVRADFKLGPRLAEQPELVWATTIVLVSFLDGLIIWLVWKLARPKSTDPSATPTAPANPIEPTKQAVASDAMSPTPKKTFTLKPPLYAAVFHLCLLALFLAFFLFVVPHFVARFKDFAVYLPAITAWTISFGWMIQRWFCIVALPLLAITAGLPFLVHYLGGRLLLLIYSCVVFGALAAITLVAALSLALPIMKLMTMTP